MTPRDFTYWLQGYFEVSGAKEVDEKKLAMIKEHLELVFRELEDQKPKQISSGQGVSTGVFRGFGYNLAGDVEVSC